MMQWQCWWGGSGPTPARPSGRQALPLLRLLFKPGCRSLPALVRDIDVLLSLPILLLLHTTMSIQLLYVILCASGTRQASLVCKTALTSQGSSPMQGIVSVPVDSHSLQPLAMHRLTLLYVQNRPFKCKGSPKEAQVGMAVHSEVLLQPMLSACQLKQQSTCCKVCTPL